MQWIFGLIFMVGGAVAAWWAFNQATAVDDLYNLVGMGAVIVGIIGILLIFFRIRKWWLSE